MSRQARRSENATDVVLALLSLVAVCGAVLVAIALLFSTASAVPGIGLVLLIAGLALAFEFGVRPARRQGRQPIKALGNGMRLIWSWSIRMIRGKQDL